MESCVPFIANLILLSLLAVNVTSGNCIFDEIQPKNWLQKHINYKSSKNIFTEDDHHFEDIQKTRYTRSISSLYKPIRIATHYDELLDEELTQSDINRLHSTLQRALDKAMNLFSVIPVQETLLLRRSDEACSIKWSANGTSGGLCAAADPGYKETCLDQYEIPAAHLEGLYVYDRLGQAQEIFAQGSGVPNSDFVLYVRARSTELCLLPGRDLIAYAAYCQVDQKFRPIAGYINFCPMLFRGDNFDEDRIYFTALHELFHALGFSKELFNHFQNCSGEQANEIICYEKPTSVKTVHGGKRLVSKKVVDIATRHYNCTLHATNNEFGPLLETSTDGSVQSHWDAAFMQSSLMTPTIGLPHLTFVDPITLAFFEDTGWYKVRTNLADSYMWGKNEGCDFGLYPECLQEDDCFCSNEGASGCHYLHNDKGMCGTDASLHMCQIYKASVQDNCEMPQNKPSDNILSLHGESYQPGSKCFFANLTKSSEQQALEGRCYKTICKNGQMHIKVGSSSYQLCPGGKSITVPGYNGLIKCLNHDLQVCVDDRSTSPPKITKPTQPVTAEDSSTDGNGLDKVCLDIAFEMNDYTHLTEREQIPAFKVACTTEIQDHTYVSAERIVDIVVYEGSVHYKFDLYPPSMIVVAFGESDEPGPLNSEIVTKLQETVNMGNFTFILNDGIVYTATNIVKLINCKKTRATQFPLVSTVSIASFHVYLYLLNLTLWLLIRL